jgi:hypothetical protein
LQFVPPANLFDDSCKQSTKIERKSGLQSLPSHSIDVLYWRLKLQVKESSIPNAHVGVFVRAEVLHPVPTGNSHFILQLGNLIDMGMYALLAECNKITTHISRLKCFIHGPDIVQKNLETALKMAFWNFF